MTKASNSAADPFFTTRHCNSADEFINAISPRSDAFQSCSTRAWVFRGHSSDSFPLLPSSLRNSSQGLRELTGFMESPINSNHDQVWAECLVLKNFLEMADSIGLTLPEDTQTLRRWLEQPVKTIKLWPPSEILSLMALAHTTASLRGC